MNFWLIIVLMNRVFMLRILLILCRKLCERVLLKRGEGVKCVGFVCRFYMFS